MQDAAAWVAAVAAIVSVLVSFVALLASRNAMRSTQTVETTNGAIRLALAEFREELGRDKLLVNQEVIDFRFKGEDDKIRQLDHRLTRNTEHVTLILSVLLKNGVEVNAIKKHFDLTS